MMRAAGNRQLIPAAMIFAVAMTFIDQTIASPAIPELRKDLGLSATGTQWIINAHLLALSALFAFGGRLADIAGHRRMSIGLAILGTILIIQNKSNIEGSLGALGVPKEKADAVAGPAAQKAFAAVQTDFAESTQVVSYTMAGILVATYVVAHIRLPEDRVAQEVSAPVSPEAEGG